MLPFRRPNITLTNHINLKFLQQWVKRYDKAEINKIPYLCYDYTNKIPGETTRLYNNEYII